MIKTVKFLCLLIFIFYLEEKSFSEQEKKLIPIGFFIITSAKQLEKL